MKGLLLSATDAVAYGAKLAGVEVVPHFPAPFSVEIAKRLSEISKTDVFEVDSSSSAIAAALGASAAGKRVLVPVSSPLTYEAFSAPSMRLPFVMVNISRSLHGIKSDLTAAMALRDAGYISMFPETNQEIYDSVILAFRIAEDPRVALPVLINIDGLANFSEPVQVANDIKGFLGKVPKHLDAKKPMNIDLFAQDYSELAMQHQKALENVLDVLPKAEEKWKAKFRRTYGLVEKFMTDDADIIMVTMGYHTSTAKSAVKRLRSMGKKVGVLRIRVFRPWPSEEIRKVLEGKKVVVFDQAVSLGARGVLASHIKGASSVISLGKYLSEKDFIDVITRVEKSDNLRLWL
jgi:pyruvate ferredoxin oxidoreductase alpha subunit